MSLNVRLNGSNYVSDKTKAAFEQALTDGRKVKVAGNGNGHAPAVPPPLASVPAK